MRLQLSLHLFVVDNVDDVDDVDSIDRCRDMSCSGQPKQVYTISTDCKREENYDQDNVEEQEEDR